MQGDIQKQKQQITVLLNSLKSMDAIIIASSLATFIYLQNRKTLQKQAELVFNDIAASQNCAFPSPAIIPDVVSPPFKETLTCPVSTDNVITPHIPFEDKASNISCEIQLSPDTSINAGSQQDIAVKALYENQSIESFNILVKTGDTLDIRTQMATYNGNKVYPSVTGIVENVIPNKIYVKDIADPDETYIGELVQQLQNLYQEQNDTKFFIKDFYLPSWYPVMLKYSPLIDGKLSIIEALALFYQTGGVIERWQSVMLDYNKQKKDWEKRNKNIAGKDNVEKKAKDEKMGDIQIELDQSEATLFNYLIADGGRGIQEAQITKPDEAEFTLIEFYFSLLASLSAFYDKNTIVTDFTKQINDFLLQRYFVDKYSIVKIESKINKYCLELSQGTHFDAAPNFYQILLQKWNSSKLKAGEKFTAGQSYLNDLAKNNTKNTDDEKATLTTYTLFLFDFSIQITNMIITKYATTKTKWQLTKTEGSTIESFFNNLWKRYKEIPVEISDLMKQMDDISRTFSTYSIQTINGEQYRWYSIGDQACETPDETNPYLSPKSKKGYGDISYWLRYCSFATLASVANPATSWSTGFPPPLGPIPFPTVYIPAKAFETKWGFIVVGLTITGIFPFPWALFVNWSTEYHVPVADPTVAMQNEVNALKKEMNNQISNFKTASLQPYLNKLKIDVTNTETSISELEDEKRTNFLAKPKRDRTILASQDIPQYTDALATWTTNSTAIDERILGAERNKLVAETKYKIVQDAIEGAPVAQNADAKIQSFQKMQASFNSQFDKLDTLVAKIGDTLAPLPISLKPETANFAFTAKNPKPIIKMASDLDQTINSAPLSKITAGFELKNEDLMSSNYGSVLSSSFNNFKSYKNTLIAAMSTIIKADPFPKYENLSPANLPWMAFLFKSWAPTGATTYGFPGFPPLPT